MVRQCDDGWHGSTTRDGTALYLEVDWDSASSRAAVDTSTAGDPAGAYHVQTGAKVAV